MQEELGKYLSRLETLENRDPTASDEIRKMIDESIEEAMKKQPGNILDSSVVTSRKPERGGYLSLEELAGDEARASALIDRWVHI